jgi:hypothetical protein
MSREAPGEALQVVDEIVLHDSPYASHADALNPALQYLHVLYLMEVDQIFTADMPVFVTFPDPYKAGTLAVEKIAIYMFCSSPQHNAVEDCGDHTD